MVGHTGVFEAAVKACEAVDICTKDVVTAGLENGYTTLLIADHGNCGTMINWMVLSYRTHHQPCSIDID